MSDWSLKDEAEFKRMKIFSPEGKSVVDACIYGVNKFSEFYDRYYDIRKVLNLTIIDCSDRYPDSYRYNAFTTGADMMYDWLK